MFPNEELEQFAPELIYIHTSNRNITAYPKLSDTKEEIDRLLDVEMERFEGMWERLRKVYGCPIIQNNFEYPFYRLLGNKDASDIHGRIHFISALNERFYQYAQCHENFYINDIQYLSACYGIDRWSDPLYWHLYKYCCALPAIPELSYNIVRIIKSLYGKNKKGLVLDLDNTLWGGVVGDDGVEQLEIGQETSMGQVYLEFQEYLKAQKDLGILLTVDSKNEYENAIAGLNHPDGVLKPDDFVSIKANWNPKDANLIEIAGELTLLPESMVFVDDNPAERAIVRAQVPGAKENAKRKEMQASFGSYEEYLRALDMHAVIRPFEELYISRITQLTNKSNQFNLTTRRYAQPELEQISQNAQYITLYGKLSDRFGDNGVVSVVIAEQKEDALHIDLWLMSCRVLKRDMEYAMMDALVQKAQERGAKGIYGYYYPTAKNAMVKEFYALQGFERISEKQNGDTVWYLDLRTGYENKNKVIQVEE
jgi:HAD superfamily phosphatase (TIGR01681 family)